MLTFVSKKRKIWLKMFQRHKGGGIMSEKFNIVIDQETEEFLTMITQLKQNNKERYMEAKGLIKGILLTEEQKSETN